MHTIHAHERLAFVPREVICLMMMTLEFVGVEKSAWRV